MTPRAVLVDAGGSHVVKGGNGTQMLRVAVAFCDGLGVTLGVESAMLGVTVTEMATEPTSEPLVPVIVTV